MASALCDSALALIGIPRWKFTANVVTVVAVAVALATSGCGGDEEQGGSAPRTAAPTETVVTESAPAKTLTEGSPGAPTETTLTSSTPEDQPGGAGDEEPARTLALFTARDGRITPPVVRVPAFISIQVELRSADGQKYGLRFGGVTITAGGGLNSVSTTIDGLRPGKAIVGTPTGPGNRVRVEATAEPGP
jgi:hypothetical protein